MKVLTAQANSATIGDSERNMVQKEFSLLLQQVDLNAQNARWGDTSLFSGGAGAATALGVVAEGQTGLTAVANGFAATLNAASQGMISGIATSATVTPMVDYLMLALLWVRKPLKQLLMPQPTVEHLP